MPAFGARRGAAVLLLAGFAGLLTAATAAVAAAAPASLDVSADIYNGVPAPAGLFDFMVSMKELYQDNVSGQLKTSHMCGGALISADTVLTAAHCVVTPDFTVPASALVLEVQGVPYEASKIFVHPEFNYSSLDAWNNDLEDGFVEIPPRYNDIAAIKLAEPVPNPPLVQLPAAGLKLQVGQTVEVAGWGRLGGAEDLPPSDTLRYAPLELVAPFDFNNQGAPGTCPAPTFPDMLCAINNVNGANACAGDSGGPLVLRDYIAGTATVVGIVSNGPSCSDSNVGFYTDLVTYLSIIAEWVASPP